MISINDLNITSDILPIYNFTLNNLSKSFLEKLLYKKPDNIDISIENQKRIGFLTQQKTFLEKYNYSSIHFNGTYYFIHQLEEYETVYLSFINPFDVLDFPKIIQTNIFIQQLYILYSQLEGEEMPHLYVEIKERLAKMYTDFEVEKTLEINNQRLIKRKNLIKIYQRIFAKKEYFISFFELLIEAEAFISIAKATLKNGFTIPILTKNELKLNQFYHPKIKNPVKNDFKPNKNLILISGANMSGKSTFFKSISLCVYLANLGLSIPADFSEIPFYETINIRISHQDDLSNGYSHFMSEIVNLKQYLIDLKSNKNVIGFYDELFSGTNTKDAMELLTATINGLCKNQHGLTFISSHIHELKEELEQNNLIEIYHLECILEENQPIYTYQLIHGYNDLKIGQIIFKNEGLFDLL